jgi:tyrosine-specific transport protein
MKSKMLGGIFLVCGTSIGTGILGVPSITAESGFGYSMILFALCWVFSTLAALYYMEAHLWQSTPAANLLSMTHFFFGPKAKVAVWVIYLSLLYSLMCTYLLAGSSWISESALRVAHIPIGSVTSMLMFIGLIGLFVFFGIRAVDRVNRLMSIGLGVCLMVILWMTLPTVSQSILQDKSAQLAAMPRALPLLITAFGYSIIVPSLSVYFKKQAHALQKTILIGSLITWLIYALWELATLGNIPLLGSHGLRVIAHSKDNGTEVANALIYFSHHAQLSMVLTLFAVFAVITSFLGVSMALYHALVDGLNLESKGVSGLTALFLTYIPPMVFLLVFPTGFSQILSWAGVLVALLMGLLPTAMVWKGRYQDGLSGYQVVGGKPLLIGVAVFFVGVILAELFYN